MAKQKNFEYPGEDATVKWHGPLCIHVGECGRAKGDLFVGGRKPWCEPDQASVEYVSDVISRCPTGALTVEIAGKGLVEKAEAANTVTVAYNGPLFVRGDLDIDAAPPDAPGLRFRAALCRCGQSQNKPYCDNSHEKAGFRDYGAVGETGDGKPGQGGPLKISPVKDGPLIFEGQFSIQNGSGQDAWHGKRAAICRCGESGNKPFCDGSHKAAGFRSD